MAPQPATGQSFRQWAQSQPLSDSLSRAEAGVRAKPQDASARWLLFELLCVLGHWERALKQLQAWAALAKDADATAHVLRGLIRAENQRIEVFAGRRVPATVLPAHAEPRSLPVAETDTASANHLHDVEHEATARPTTLFLTPPQMPHGPHWTAGMADALLHAASPGAAASEASDLAREAALAMAPASSGRSNLQPAFGWIT
ncbi:MAG: hypothetical protein JWQ88_2797, partial [Rhodoferax sp.]|nr:hypothetical protein [Rhodoferax sp.]